MYYKLSAANIARKQIRTKFFLQGLEFFQTAIARPKDLFAEQKSTDY